MLDQPDWDRGGAIGYVEKLINLLKIQPIQSISILLGPKYSCRLLRQPVLPPSPTFEIILLTDARTRYGDQIDNFLGFLR
jgi:hypothetical protein